MTFTFNVPLTSGETLTMNLDAGSSIIFVGANGSGKTRLATHIEEKMGDIAHRVAAHRSLNLDLKVPKVSEGEALQGLRFGSAGDSITLAHRELRRWRQNAATSLLDDFGFVLQALFAEQTNTAVEALKNLRSGTGDEAELTKFEILQDIWEKLLPHRNLSITGDDIQVGATGIPSYGANHMSDGERAIFYLIAQTLLAAPSSLLIVDEPELHIHRSIIGNLWDELEAARSDCGFIFITHDIEFASNRDATKFSLKSYTAAPSWEVEPIPTETGFGEELTTLILGSRNPVLFVEGDNSSLDVSLYRHCIPSKTIIPAGSCEAVIHSVSSMRKHEQLTRISCSGLIDADGQSQDDVDYFNSLGVSVLPVAEIENILMLPTVSEQIALCNGYSDAEANSKVNDLNTKIISFVQSDANIARVKMRHCRRRINRTLKKIDLCEASNIEALAAVYIAKTSELDVTAIAAEFEENLDAALDASDIPALLAVYDNKGLLNLAASTLADRKLGAFKQWLGRLLRNGNNEELVAAINAALPEI